MFSIKTWLKNRKVKVEEDSYIRGFRWCMSAYYIEKLPLAHINSLVASFDYSRFDAGADDALDIIKDHLAYIKMDTQSVETLKPDSAVLPPSKPARNYKRRRIMLR